MTNEPGPQTKAVRELLAAKPSAEDIAPVKDTIAATHADYSEALQEISRYELMELFSARPALLSLADMLPDDGPVLRAGGG